MKLVWKLQLDNKSRQLHNLFPPMIVSDVQTPQGPKQIGVVAGVSDNVYGIDLDTGKQLWKRTFDSTFDGAGQRPRRLHAVPRRPDRDAGRSVRRQTPGKFIVYAISWDGRLRQLDVATGEDVAPPELFLPPNGKPYGLNLVQERHLHDDGAGLRRQSEPVLQLRPGDEEGRQLQPGQRRPVAAPRAVDRQGRQRLRRQRRRRLLPRAAGLRPGDRRGEAEPDDEGARDDRLVRAVERGLAAQARSRHERDRPGLRLQGQGVHRASRARSAASGCSTRARWAARITARRSIARRSSATRKCSSPPPVRGARSRPGRTPTARAGC